MGSRPILIGELGVGGFVIVEVECKQLVGIVGANGDVEARDEVEPNLDMLGGEFVGREAFEEV